MKKQAKRNTVKGPSSKDVKVCTLYMLFDGEPFTVDVFRMPGGRVYYVDDSTPEAIDTDCDNLTKLIEELHYKYCFFPVGTVIMLAPFDNGEEKIPAEAATIEGEFEPSKTYCVRLLKPGKGDDGLREITPDQIQEVIKPGPKPKR